MELKNKLVLALLLGAMALSSQAAPFSNGGFNNNPHNGVYLELETGNTRLSPWEVTKGNVDLIGTYWSSDKDGQSLDILGSNTSVGEISQTFDTTPNKKYLVQFKMSGNPYSGEAVRVLDVSVKNSDIDSLHYEYDIFKNNANSSNMNWKSHSFIFTAQSNSATLIFTGSVKSGSKSNFGPALDSVSVTVVNDSGTCCCPCDK